MAVEAEAAAKTSRGKLAAGLGQHGLESKSMELYAKKICAKNLLNEDAEAMTLGEEWINETPHQRRAGLCCGWSKEM